MKHRAWDFLVPLNRAHATSTGTQIGARHFPTVALPDCFRQDSLSRRVKNFSYNYE
jgi:hypothetical protein